MLSWYGYCAVKYYMPRFDYIGPLGPGRQCPVKYIANIRQYVPSTGWRDFGPVTI